MKARFATLCFIGLLGLAACGGDDPSEPSSTATVLTVTNKLLIPIQVNVNGKSVGRIEAGVASQFNLGTIDTLKMDWDMICATMPDGEPIGYEGGGVFSTIRTTGGVKSVTIDNEIGSSIYFSPAITNASSESMKMTVNKGLPSEIQCPLEIAAGAQGVSIGYHRLYNGTSIRGYRASSDYSGPSAIWLYGSDFTTSSLEDGSGRLPLTCTKVSATVDRDGAAGKIAPRAPVTSHDDLTGEMAK